MKGFQQMTQQEQEEAYAKYLTKVSAKQAEKSGEDKPGGGSIGFQVNPEKRCRDCSRYNQEKRYCKMASVNCINTFSRPSFERAMVTVS